MKRLDLSNNSFSGVLDVDIGKSMPSLQSLILSGNNLRGEIPSSLCQLNAVVLDLSDNHFWGELPHCWNHLSDTNVIDFSSNSLSGSIPRSICSLQKLESLHLRNNNLSGELPSSLKSCKSLLALDLGQNGFTGALPNWMGESFPVLNFLSLHSNKLVGNIPPNLSRLSALQILDLAGNNLSGTIPSSFGNFTAMKVPKENYGTIFDYHIYKHDENIQVTTKGRDMEYERSLRYVIGMDLSENNLFGRIPEELTSLIGLKILNLSGNHLIGGITEKISALLWLESLDLSRNNLSGEIPSSMIALTFLSCLNLSYNNLSGKIPLDGQFITFNASTYTGNPNLCGFPLTQKCKDDTKDEQNDDAMDEEGSEMKWFYMTMGPGFVVGFWAVFGPLLFKRRWREI